jgi:hypothetical protein
VVRTLLELGANPNAWGEQDGGPLAGAMSMTEMAGTQVQGDDRVQKKGGDGTWLH